MNGPTPTFATPRMPAPGSMLWSKIHFDPDADAQGEEAKPKTYSEEHVQKIIGERDKAKANDRDTLAALADLGIEVEYVTDGDKRVRKLKGVDELKALRDRASADAEDGQRKNGKWDDRKAELEQQHTVKVQKITQGHQRTLAGRDAIIGDLAVAAPLREALAAEEAYDADGDGKFADAVALLRPRLRSQIDEDEETGTAKLTVLVLGDDGKPLLDSKTGDPVTIRQFVKAWLDKRPNHRKANYQPGPNGGKARFGERQRPASVEQHGQAAAANFFGQTAAVN